MPYLPAKDKRVSLNRFSSWGLWKLYNSKVLDRRLYGVGQHFTFCRFSRKKNSLETLIVIFEKVLPKGFFWLNMKDFENSVLTANSRCLQTAALNNLNSGDEFKNPKILPLWLILDHFQGFQFFKESTIHFNCDNVEVDLGSCLQVIIVPLAADWCESTCLQSINKKDRWLLKEQI